MKPTPVDLKAEFGDTYRIQYEETLPPGFGRDPWFAQIRCRHGHIFVYGDDELGVSVDGKPNVAGVIRKMPCVRVTQDGDFGELNGAFHRDDLDTVLQVMRPYRRKQCSAETLERLRDNASRLRKENREPLEGKGSGQGARPTPSATKVSA